MKPILQIFIVQVILLPIVDLNQSKREQIIDFKNFFIDAANLPFSEILVDLIEDGFKIYDITDEVYITPMLRFHLQMDRSRRKLHRSSQAYYIRVNEIERMRNFNTELEKEILGNYLLARKEQSLRSHQSLLLLENK